VVVKATQQQVDGQAQSQLALGHQSRWQRSNAYLYYQKTQPGPAGGLSRKEF
jgi:hypothetical protein